MTSETEIEYVSHMAANHAYCGLRFDPGPRYGRPWHTPWYDHTEARTLHFKHPANAPGFAYLARVMVELTDNSRLDSADWRGGAVWYQDYDVWDHRENVTGRTMIERIRAGYGELRPFGSATVNIFRDNDLAILPAFLLAPLIFGWDAYYISQERGAFAYISHDEYWTLTVETTARFEALVKKIGSHNEEHWLRDYREIEPSRFVVS